VLAREFSLTRYRIQTDAYALRAQSIELSAQIPEVTTLLGAARGHCGGVEEQDNGSFGKEL
jgi:hypothetical protein